MFGRLIDGQSAGPGTLLLGEMDIDRRQRVFAVPVQLEGNAHCLIVPEFGQAFVPTSSWLDATMWDVTNHVQPMVDPKAYELSNRAPVHGEIAYADGDWLIPAITNERRPDRLSWISIGQGCPVQASPTMLRFPTWKLVHQLSGHDFVTVFQPQLQQQQPWIIASSG